MKNLLASFLMIGLSYTAQAQFQDRYVGFYTSEEPEVDALIDAFVPEIYGDIDLGTTSEDKVAFVFEYTIGTTSVQGAAVAKGENFTSITTGGVPSLTFAFSVSGGHTYVKVTPASGKAMIWEKDGVYSSDEGNVMEEEQLPVTEYAGVNELYFRRGDNDQVMINFVRPNEDNEDPVVGFLITIPEKTGCPFVMLAGVLDPLYTLDKSYTYNDPYAGYTLEFKPVNNNLQLRCTKGKYMDQNDKCGWWKEPFVPTE